MATENTYLKVTELDFDEIRNNIKTYLSTQTQFKDYNYEGSAMAVLLDILAYNTHYGAYYTNMLANEMFLDTAQQRDSVVSRAKELGYTPVSAQGATANVNISFTGIDSLVNQIILQKNSTFTTKIDDISYTYVTPEAYTIKNSNGSFSKDIQIREGEPLTHRFEYSGSPDQKFVLPNKNIDTETIQVFVQTSSTDTSQKQFFHATNIISLNGSSEIFFIEESFDEQYEILFGNGILGKALVQGNIIIVEYNVCNATKTNGAKTFSSDTIILDDSYSNVSVTTNNVASGGRERESVSSIKFNAPRFYETQNRAIISNDYERILLNENSDLQSVVSFGGEYARPAVYGKVYIAVKPYLEEYVTNTRKTQLRESIIDRTPVGIDPVMIDPNYTYIIPVITTYYNKTTSTVTDAEIESVVRTTITDYSENNLERFGSRLRFSKFLRELDNLSIVDVLNNEALMKLQNRFVPNVNYAEKVDLIFNNPIRPGTVTSSQFTYSGFNCYFDDDSLGNINIFRYNAEKQKVNILVNAGTVDYNTGHIIIESFFPSAYSGIQIRVTVEPERLDIIPVREQILILDENDADITIVGEYQ